MPDSMSGLFGAFESDIRWSKLFLVPRINIKTLKKEAIVKLEHVQKTLLKNEATDHSYPVVSLHWLATAGPCPRSWICVGEGWSAPWQSMEVQGCAPTLLEKPRAGFHAVAWHFRECENQQKKKVIKKKNNTVWLERLVNSRKKTGKFKPVWWKEKFSPASRFCFEHSECVHWKVLHSNFWKQQWLPVL